MHCIIYVTDAIDNSNKPWCQLLDEWRDILFHAQVHLSRAQTLYTAHLAFSR